MASIVTLLSLLPAHAGERGCTLDRKNMWGYADLHAHPAVHLGFGADDAGENGIFHGKPGSGYTSDPVAAAAQMAADLPSCDGNNHDTAFGVPQMLQDTIFRAMDTSGGGNHYPDSPFTSDSSWPDARSVTHQQMHIQWIRRAYEGGLRLMVASAVDNQVMSQLWTKNLGMLDDPLSGTSEDDYTAAKAQLSFIRDLVAKNSDWMVYATDAATAECGISEGKLVIVPGLELDSLTADQILDLRAEFGAVVVNPIHMANNTFGGSAAYSDILNASNRALRGDHFAVRFDPSVRFRFGTPLILDAGLLPAIVTASACDLAYEACGPLPAVDAEHVGVANALGLTEEGEDGVLELWKAGMVVDLAHMSDLAQDRVLELARVFQMPVIDSHTDLRPDLIGPDPLVDRRLRSISERSLRLTAASKIGDLGGMIGLGTEGTLSPQHVLRQDGNPLAMLTTGGDPLVVRAERPHLRIAVRTGGMDPAEGPTSDGMRGDTNLQVSVHADGSWTAYQIVFDPPDAVFGDTVNPGEIFWATVELPEDTQVGSIDEMELYFYQDNWEINADNWNVDGLQVFYVGRTQESKLLGEFFASGDDYLHRFTLNEVDVDHSPWWSVPLGIEPDRQVVQLDVWTGGDDLRCRSDALLDVQFADGSLWADPLGHHLASFLGLSGNSAFERPIALPAGYGDSDIDQISLELVSGPGCAEPLAGQDNWSIDRLLLSRWQYMGRRVSIDRSGGPAFRLTGDDPIVAVAAELDREESIRSLSPRYVRVVVKTGFDDWDLAYQAALEDGRTATGTLTFGGGTMPVQTVSFPLNEETDWAPGSTHWAVVDLGTEVPALEISEVTVALDGDPAEWWVQAVEVEALVDPIAAWAEDYALVLPLMHNRGVAMGTDLNGFQPQLSFSPVDPSYPLAVPFAVPASFGLAAPMSVGVRTFDFAADGISSYGQLPEFVAAVGEAGGGAGTMLPFFGSAKDFVDMWKQVEGVASSL